MRSAFFGAEASTAPVTEELRRAYPEFRSHELDIRDAEGVERLFAEHAGAIEVVVHTAAQPSHDWAAREPQTDFGVNANGTLNLLEAARAHCPDAPFIFCSTNKVYGDTPNRLPLRGPADPAGAARGPPLLPGHRHVDVDRPLDPLAVRRLEGRRRPAGPGVRALLRHAHRLLPRRLPHRPAARGGEAARLPRLPDEVRGHRHAVHRLRLRGQAGPRQHPQRRPGRRVRGVPRGAAAGGRLQHRRRPLLELLDAGGDRGLRADRRAASSSGSWARSPAIGDHRWWISDLAPFEADYPDWSLRHGIDEILTQIYEHNLERWMATVG